MGVLGAKPYFPAGIRELTMRFINLYSAPIVGLLFCGRMIGGSLLILMAAGAALAASDPSMDGPFAAARQTERGTRADDKRSETAMEDRKKEGYF